MRIVFVHGHMIHSRTWRRVQERLREDGIDLVLLPQWQAGEYLARMAGAPPQVILCDLYRDLPGFEAVLAAASQTGLRVGLGLETPPGFSNLNPANMANVKAYLYKLSADNYREGMRLLASLAGLEILCDPPSPVRAHALRLHRRLPGLVPAETGLGGRRQYRRPALLSQPV